jgi:sigma-B regulation protein RsbU (phosphoserine phosphatase)
LDLESSTLSLASAGHPGIYHMRNKSIQIIESRGRALGITENAKYKFISLPLQKGDRIFMVTDGLIEVKDNSNGLLGEDGLKEILMSNSKQSIQEAVHSIIDNIISFSNEKDFSDDATMIVLDWKN